MLKIILILALVWVPLRCDSDGLVCELVRDICCNETERYHRQQRIPIERGPAGVPGRTGKAGPRGFPGPPGRRGTPGKNASVDYQKISEIIQEKIHQELRNLTSKNIELRRTVKQLQVQRCRDEGLVYGDICYIAVAFSPYSISYENAVEKCDEIGCTLAEIHNLTHQIALEEFTRSKIPSDRQHLDFWSGLTFERSRNRVRFTSGKTMKYTRFQWLARYPLYNDWWPTNSVGKPVEKILLKTNRDSSANNRGLFFWAEDISQAVLCEIPL